MPSRRRDLILVAVVLSLGLMSGVADARAGSSGSSHVAFAPYIDMTLSPAPDLPGIGRASGVRQISLGFVTAAGGTSCRPTWGGYAADPAAGSHPFRLQNIASFRRAGGSVVPSFGGQAGTELASACRSVASLERAYAGVVAAYHPRRVDFDIEGAAVTQRGAIERRSRAIAALERRYRRLQVSFTLPVLPTGLDPDALGVLRSSLAHHVKVTYVNLMTMDYGDAAAPDPAGKMGTYAIRAARATSHQLHRLYPRLSGRRRMRMIGLTPMIGVGDTSDEVFTLADAAQLARFARSQPVGMLAMWELSRDHQCPQPATRARLTCSGVSQSDYEFAKTLVDG